MRRRLEALSRGARCCLFVDGLNSQLVSDGGLEVNEIIVVTDPHALAAHEYWHLGVRRWSETYFLTEMALYPDMKTETNLNTTQYSLPVGFMS